MKNNPYIKIERQIRNLVKHEKISRLEGKNAEHELLIDLLDGKKPKELREYLRIISSENYQRIEFNVRKENHEK